MTTAELQARKDAGAAAARARQDRIERFSVARMREADRKVAKLTRGA